MPEPKYNVLYVPRVGSLIKISDAPNVVFVPLANLFLLDAKDLLTPFALSAPLASRLKPPSPLALVPVKPTPLFAWIFLLTLRIALLRITAPLLLAGLRTTTSRFSVLSVRLVGGSTAIFYALNVQLAPRELSCPGLVKDTPTPFALLVTLKVVALAK